MGENEKLKQNIYRNKMKQNVFLGLFAWTKCEIKLISHNFLHFITMRWLKAFRSLPSVPSQPRGPDVSIGLVRANGVSIQQDQLGALASACLSRSAIESKL